MRKLYFAVTLVSLLACRKADTSAQVSGSPETVTYAKELDVHLDHMTKQPSGLYVLDIKEGTGPAIAAGQTAQTSIWQPSTVQDPGSKVWTTQEPNDGQASSAGGVALQVSAGVSFQGVPIQVSRISRAAFASMSSGRMRRARVPERRSLRNSS